ncbi:thioredoxin domain-containing protein [Streptomyces sp. 549]|uniref:thioredoxin domain-containing protein n=1 Tax=Streptomyces sp. 549 TaxID=3049076 RepID=UPI0024C28F93|nr:thioredoxin domain-containing protein [Streptomyces sp. 549]MDK1475612.1 thioredoxin domain-containing protein [Streptomyces sp. 549]
MSKRNSQEAKREARERLRIEREKQAKKDKLKRNLGIGVAAIAVLAIAGGIGVAVTNMGGSSDGDASDWDAAAKVADSTKASGQYKGYETPAGTEGKDGTDLFLGDKDAKNTVTVYEDMRCPVCASFEQANGEVIEKDIEDGKYKAEFVFGTFLDKNPSIAGTGSKNALSALGAAYNVSPEAFLEYKKLLYSAEHHPDESGPDKFGEDEHLIELAQDIKELKGNKEFEDAVNNGTFDPWAVKMSQKFDDAKDVTGTPTVKVNGEKAGVGEQQNAPMAPDQYNQVIDSKLKK